MATTLRSFAKINLGLRIGPPGMRADGFHELRTIYQTIALHDTIKIAVSDKSGTGIEIRCQDARVPCDESNTCYKVAERVMKSLKTRGKVVITIEKHLPVQGGMGAASSNAIATMLGMERKLKKQLEPDERLRIAEEVGSDLPLFLLGGTVLGIGRGEQVYPLPDVPSMHLVVATPAVGVSTPKAFAAWDALFEPYTARSGAQGADGGAQLTAAGQSARLNEFSRSLYAWLRNSNFSATGVPAKSGDRAEALLLDLVRAGIENDFERVVFPQFPQVRDIKRALEHSGASYASLSGSGSTVFGLFASKAEAVGAAQGLKAKGIAAQATRMLSRQQYWRGL